MILKGKIYISDISGKKQTKKKHWNPKYPDYIGLKIVIANDHAAFNIFSIFELFLTNKHE